MVIYDQWSITTGTVVIVSAFFRHNAIAYLNGTSLVAQWLRLYNSTAGSMGSILGHGTKIKKKKDCSIV